MLPSGNGHDGILPYEDMNGGYDEDAALSHAISMSLKDSSDTQGGTQHHQVSITALPSTNFGGLRLDRKKMEEERLARQRKRTAEDAEISHPAPRPKLAAQRPLQPSGELGSRLATTHSPPVSKPNITLPFARGVVKRTKVAGLTRDTDDITLDEIFDRQNLDMAVLTSFQWDEQWLLSKIDITRTRMVLIAYANSEAQVPAFPHLQMMLQCPFSHSGDGYPRVDDPTEAIDAGQRAV